MADQVALSVEPKASDDDPWEVVEERVRGVPMHVFKHRLRSLGELFDTRTERFADRTHLVFGPQRTSFAELADRVSAIAGGLARRGVGRGDRVAILGANHPAWAETLWATTRLGGILVGLNSWWAADELAFALRDAEPAVLVVDQRRLERISSLLGPKSRVRHIVVIDGTGAEAGATEPYTALVEGDPESGPFEVDEDDPAVILYTSGTTGRSKGAIWTHRSMLAALQSNAALLARARAQRPDSPQSGTPVPAPPKGAPRQQIALLLSLPMFHTSGLQAGLVTAMTTGAKAVIFDGRFRPEEVLRLIETEKVVAWAAVPTMVLRVLDYPDLGTFDLSSLRSISYGGSPSGGDLQQRVQAAFGIGVRVGNSFGMTETTAAVITIDGPEYAERPDAVGRPHPLVEVRMVDEGGRDVPTGQRGEMLIKGPTVMAGYWRNPEATAATIEDGWLHTGDVAELDADGYVYIRDRKKDMVIRGGENVYCAEIETRLEQHPAIVEAAIIGKPHPTLGEEVKAVVVVGDGSRLTPDDVKAWVAETLAHFKVPSEVDIVTEPLPRNPTGKILKNLLRHG